MGNQVILLIQGDFFVDFGDLIYFGDFGESGDSGEFVGSGNSGDFGDLVNPVILVNSVKVLNLVISESSNSGEYGQNLVNLVKVWNLVNLLILINVMLLVNLVILINLVILVRGS